MSGYGKSDTGKVRMANEDSILVKNCPVGPLLNLYAVADGMGGHLAGEVASKTAIDSLLQYLENNAETQDSIDTANILEKAIFYANETVYNKAIGSLSHRGMGTTLLAATVKDDKAYIANVGDSRLYAVNKERGEIKQITMDHSYVMELVRKGEITAEEAEHHPNKNIITRALGTVSRVIVDKFIYGISNEDMLILCSDGLNNMLSDAEILDVCVSSRGKRETVDKLLQMANDNGGIDNTSVIIYCGDNGGDE